MKLARFLFLLMTILGPASAAWARAGKPDDLSWIEGRNDPRALAWVHRQNQATLKKLRSDPRYNIYYRIALALRRERAETDIGDLLVMHGNRLYVVKISADHPKGVLLTTSIASFKTASPSWTTILDVDELDRKFQVDLGVPSLMEFSPDGKRAMLAFEHDRRISWREVDPVAGGLVDGGFETPPARYSTVAWRDDDTLLAATDFGPGSLNDEGDPLSIRELRRGQPLSSAKVIVNSSPASTYDVFLRTFSDSAGERAILAYEVGRENRNRLRTMVLTADDHFAPTILPENITAASVQGEYHGELILRLEGDWRVSGRTFGDGASVTVPVADLVSATPRVSELPIHGPAGDVVESVRVLQTGLLVHSTLDLEDRFTLWRNVDGNWRSIAIRGPHLIGSRFLSLGDLQDQSEVFVTAEGLITPKTLYSVDTRSNAISPVRSDRTEFVSAGLTEEKLQVRSTDGVAIPYIVVRPKGAVGPLPTIITGYGAFGASLGLVYHYDGTLGRLWLEQGGAYVVGFVRGGSEFGPAWHVVRKERSKTYEDYLAVAEDLIRRKLATPAQLGTSGLSAGGLLSGSVITQRSDLFHAAFLEVPFLDNFRLDLGNGGVSQQGEYGVPGSSSDEKFLRRTSPFQNAARIGRNVDPFIYSNTTDTNVYPAGPRRFAARLDQFGIPHLYFEAASGGHSLGRTPEEWAQGEALCYIYFAERLGLR